MKLRNLILLGLIVSAIGCGKDNLSESVVGDWILEAYSISCEGEETLNLVPDENGCIVRPDDEMECIKFTFTNGGVVTFDSGYEMNDGTYTVDDDSDELTICFDGDCRTFMVEDNKFVLALDEYDCRETLNFLKEN